MSCTLCNIHAPFTENEKTYKAFFNKVKEKIHSMGQTDTTFLFGDFNSRCILKTNANKPQLLLKDIHLKENTYTSHDRLNILNEIKTSQKNKQRKIDYTMKTPLLNNVSLNYVYTDWTLHSTFKH